MLWHGDLESINWSALTDAFGSAAGVPDLLQAVAVGDLDARHDALERLWGTVWHQDTVYDSSPVVVPFLTDIVANADLDADVRVEVAGLLAGIGFPASFVLPEDPTRLWPARWRRPVTDPVPHRDLDDECRAAVASSVGALGEVFTSAPRQLRAALVAVFATVADRLPRPVLADLADLEDDPDVRLAAAVRLTRALADETALTRDLVAHCAAVDADAADYLQSIPDWSLPAQAVEIARELAIQAAD